MKRYTPFFFAALVGMFFITNQYVKTPERHSSTQLTIYDTAVLMLAEFITQSNDSNLGFKNFDELQEAYIDPTQGINVYYGLEDSLMKDSVRGDLLLLNFGRTIYPVYYHGQLRSAITFDSTIRGWHPCIWEDSNVISSCVADSGWGKSGNNRYSIIRMPSLHSFVAMRTNAAGEHILPTKELRTELREHYPQRVNTPELSPINKTDFVIAVRNRLLQKRYLMSLQHRQPGKK